MVFQQPCPRHTEYACPFSSSNTAFSVITVYFLGRGIEGSPTSIFFRGTGIYFVKFNKERKISKF